MLEMTTGQKIPQMSGSIGEIQQGIQTIQMTLGQIIQQQQNLDQRLTNLENNATNQFTNLTNQFQSLRLTHTKERKEIEYNPNKLTDQENY
jgi:DNA anti-recombination protein RmuC